MRFCRMTPGSPYKKFAPDQWKVQLYGDYNQPYGSFRWHGAAGPAGSL